MASTTHDILQKKWRDLTDAQKEESGMSKSEFRQARLDGGYKKPNYFDRTYTMPDGSEYDSRDTGSKKFGMKDYKELQSRGMSSEEIDNMIYGEDADQNNLSTELQLRSPNYKGHTGDIMDYDPLSVGNRQVAAGRFDTPTGPEITRGDINALLGEQGGGTAYSAKEINEMIKAKGYTVGEKAQKMLNDRLGAMTGQPPTDITKLPGDDFIDTTPIKEEPKIGQPAFKPGESPTTINDMQVDTDKMNNNNYNFDFGQGQIFGNVNVGNDSSINLYNQGSTGGGLDNYASAATSIGLLENAFDRSQTKLSGTGRAATASGAANFLTGADQRIANLDYITRNNPGLFGAKADMQALNTFGDIYNPDFSAGMDFKMPEPPKPPKGVDEDLIDKFKY